MHTKLLKPLLWLLGLCLLVYVLICGYMFAQQRHMIYEGESTRVRAEQTNFSLQRPGALLRGWQMHPASPVAAAAQNVVIYFGGNAENIERRIPQLSAALPQSDIYMLAYRGYGASEGEPTEVLMEGDAVALFDEVRRLHPQARIGRHLARALEGSDQRHEDGEVHREGREGEDDPAKDIDHRAAPLRRAAMALRP